MTEENKKPLEEEAPETETAPEPQPEGEKTAKGKKKKEKGGITFTREQVEQMELAVKQLESTKDQFARLAAEYDNYRKRLPKHLKKRMNIRFINGAQRTEPEHTHIFHLARINGKAPLIAVIVNFGKIPVRVVGIQRRRH